MAPRIYFNEGLATIAERYLKKGLKVYLEGSLQTRKWTDNSGQEKYTTEMVLSGFNSQLVLLSSDNSNSTDTASSANNDWRPPENLDDEIPF